MAWTTPQTWTTGQVVAAADLNTDIRDNMLETAAATATAAGDLVYADAANSMGSRLAHPGTGRMLVSGASNALAWRQPAEDINTSAGSTSAPTSFTSYNSKTDEEPTDGSWPSVTVTTGTVALVIVSCRHASNDTGGGSVMITHSISGATSSAASDAHSALYESGAADDRAPMVVARLREDLTAGSNTFQMEAKVSGNTGTIANPRIQVIPY